MKRILLILLCVLLSSTPAFATPSDSTIDLIDTIHAYYYDSTGGETSTDDCITIPSVHSTTPSGNSITWIGDSYTAIAEDNYHLISTNLPNTDLGGGTYYQVSKHIAMNGGAGNLGGPSGLTILKDIKSQNKLKPILVFALGTNDTDFGTNLGALETQLNILIDSEHTDPTTTIILVSPRTNDSTENTGFDKMTEGMRNFANSHQNVLLADWNSAARGKESEYFDPSDSTHPNEAGFKIWFDTIKNTLPGEINNDISGLTATTSSSTLPAETIQYLDGSNVKAQVEANMERYKYAEQQTGLPWQILATLHYREAGLGSNLSISNGEELYDHINVDGIHISASPNQDAKEAAEHFIEVAKSVYNVDIIANPTTENYALGFLAYNRGFMYKNGGATWKESPYVMNGYDAEHMNMRFIHADSWFGGQQINGLEGKVNTSPGALAFLAYLGGIELSLNSTSTTTSITPTNKYCTNKRTATPNTGGPNGSGVAIAQNAVSMSWPYQDGANKGQCTTISGQIIPYTHRDGYGGCSMNPRDTYEAAVAKYNIPHANTYGYENCKDQTYCDCGMFVQTVLAATFPGEGFEGSENNPNIHEAFVDFLLSQPDKWEEVENLGNTSNLQPGDVFLNPGHRMIYVGKYGGEWGDLASASAGQNVGEIYQVYFTGSAGPFRIFRRKSTSIEDNNLTEKSPKNASSDIGQKAIEAAHSQIGKPYSYGCPYSGCGSDTDPPGFDCNGLAWWSWKQAGVDIPAPSGTSRSTSRDGQWQAAQNSGHLKKNQNELSVGDVVFFFRDPNNDDSTYHVGLYAGNGKIIHSPQPGETVTEAPIDVYGGWCEPGGICAGWSPAGN